jgi:acetyl-CoA carboxylase biotin carboxyl carrier protein
VTEMRVNSQDSDVSYFGALDADTAMDVLFRGFTGIVDASPQLPRRVNLKFGNASVEVEWPERDQVTAAPVLAVPDEPAEDGYLVTAPLVGTFYRASAPGARPYVEVGDLVEQGQQVAIVEAMKLMNAIVADQSGRVLRVLVEDGESVEYAQPLLVLDTEVAG